MTQTRLSAIAGFSILALIVAGAALWQLNPFRDQPAWVPTCSDLAAPMQAAAGGAWATADRAGRDDDSHRASDSSALCDLAFTSADQRFSGTVSVRISGMTDDDEARREAQTGDCPGSAWPAAVPAGYAALRACNALVGERISSSIRAAKGQRSLSVTLRTSIPAGSPVEDVAGFAQGTLAKLADLGLTLPENG
ncbi:hypothetical protein [Actinoplanes sp. NPDC049316]|uniref:hypothetical protein n=1 Tax=Actinoplanes sp. NPDC049316 TaxID=3154727 RepID=UPI00343C8581